MRRNTLSIALTLVTAFAGSVLCGAQTVDSQLPHLENARLEKRALTGTLAEEMKRWTDQAEQPQWLAYAVPLVAGDQAMCCGDYDGCSRGCASCRLEDGGSENTASSSDSSTGRGAVKLEGPRNMLVLYRAEGKRVVKIRALSEDCSLDAGGLSFVWLSGVSPSQSVAWLGTFVRGADLATRESRRTANRALTAIAVHADASADQALGSFTNADQPESLRKQAAFWLGAKRGKAGLAVLQKMAKSDPSAEVRSHISFALSVSPEPEALTEMIRMAREDQSAHVRGQALFWLAHKAGQKAVGAITSAIENDPDTQVKKKAVFALSRLPKDEGIPKLIEVAQTNSNPAIRKQAMFWLGQSHDPRAVAFFEKILTP